jgi:ribosome-associated heat shock protein Hsp15
MDHHADGVRLDLWLDVACLFRTRSEAQRACKSGRIDVNGQKAKPNRLLRAGDRVLIRRPLGRLQDIAVVRLADRHVARSDARALYEDRTPPPAPEEAERRRAARVHHAAMQAAGRPDKRDRRTLRRLKGRAD